jgi:hypothetical protein
MGTECRVCRCYLDRHEGVWYRGLGRLCPECDERADVVTNYRGEYVSMSISPSPSQSLATGHE